MRTRAWQFLKEWGVFVVFMVVIVAVCFNIFQAAEQRRELERVAVTTNNALCTFRADLQQRLDATVRYMDKHPGPEPIPGITRPTLRQSLQNQRRTLDALDVLVCEGS